MENRGRRRKSCRWKNPSSVCAKREREKERSRDRNNGEIYCKLNEKFPVVINGNAEDCGEVNN